MDKIDWTIRQKEIDERASKYKNFQQKWECKNNECEKFHCKECGKHIPHFIDACSGDPVMENGSYTEYNGYCYKCYMIELDKKDEAETKEMYRLPVEILMTEIELDKG